MALTFNRSFQVNLATNMTTFLGFGSDAAGLHVFEYGGNSDLIWIYPFTGGDPSVGTSISVGTGSSWSGLARSPDGYASLINRTILERDSAGASVSAENDGRTDRQLGVTWDSTDTRWLTLARDNTDLRVMSYPSLGDLDEDGEFWDIDTLRIPLKIWGRWCAWAMSIMRSMGLRVVWLKSMTPLLPIRVGR